MKRKTLVKIHLIATALATLTIGAFFFSSIMAEIKGDEVVIKEVKKVIFFSLPILFVVMPVLGITGNKLAGKSKNPIVLQKQKRMKFIMINGIILTVLACFLYYRSHYQAIDSIFIGMQLTELIFGLANLTLICLNIKSGLKLSGKLMKNVQIQI